MKTKLNVERLECIAEWLENGAKPRCGVDKFDMRDFVYLGECGTTCCIAGTANMWWGDGFSRTSNGNARKLLGLTDEQAEALFFGGCTTENGKTAYSLNISKARAARTIRRLIETGEVSWE